MKRIFSKVLPSASVLAMLMATPAIAQDNANNAAAEDSDEIVVTGTSIRGVTPAGNQAIGIDEEEITATGATSSVQLLSTVPQLSDFNGLPTVLSTSSASQQATNRPDIRGLANGASGGSPTLVLVDGHRLPGSGIIQTVTDPDIVPPGIVQRVEVVTDGGSSVYGADAVGGVINFITRRDFDGLEFSARQGFGDEYSSFDSYITGGTSWTGGSAYVSYNYAQHDGIYGRDRDYVRRVNWDRGGPAANPIANPLFGLPIGRSCNPGNLTVGGVNYNIDNSGPTPTFTVGTPASVRCDLTDDMTIYPQERRDSIFAGFSQELTDALTFEARAWYTNRVTKNDGGANFGSGADNSRIITAANNNYFQCITCLPGESQTVYYNFDSVEGLDRTVRVELETWGFNPSLTLDLGHDWQARGFLNYGNSVTKTKDPNIANTVLDANLANINFYNIGATDGDILREILTSNTEFARGEDSITNGRLVFDGPLFNLPAGEMRAAVGIEYLGESYRVTRDENADTQTRRSSAYFAEVDIPIVSAENNIPLVHSLDLSLSARHDRYSDFGEVTTPRVGLTYEPLDWVRLRGTWSESFQAPSLADTAVTGTTVSSGTPTSVLQFALPFTVPNPTTDRLMVVGGAAPLDAQRAESYSVGFDISPPVVEGLDLGLTYYNIEFKGQVGSPPVFLRNFYDVGGGTEPFFSLVRAPDGTATGAPLPDSQIIDYLTSAGVTADDIADALAARTPGTDVTLIVDFRRRNLGAVKVSGLDAYARYTLDTDFGSIFFNASGTYRLNYQIDATGLGYSSNAAGVEIGKPRWGASATLGATIGDNFRGQATLIHSAGQTISALQSNNFQSRIDPYDVVNLYFQYDLEGDGLRNNLSLSLGVNNVLDNDPSQLNGDTFNTHGYVGGNLGRLVQVGLTKRF